MRPAIFALLLGCSLWTACKKEPAPSVDVAASAAPAPSASIARPAARAPEPSVPDEARMVIAWNDTLSAHDSAALGKLYAPKVKLYGREVTRAEALKAKDAAFAAQKDFRQLVSGVKAGTGGKVSFVKTVTVAGTTRGYPGYLVLSADKKEILEESDEITDKNLAAKSDAEGQCAMAVGEVIAASAKGKAMLSQPIDPKMKAEQGCTNLGFMPFAPEPGERFASVRFHANCTDRLAFHGWLYVSTKDGCVYEDDKATGNDNLYVKLECPAGAASVTKACGVR